MPFRKAFEKRVHDEMQSTTAEAGPSHHPHPLSPSTDIKTPEKCPPSPTKPSPLYEEEEDLDLSRKPDKSLPPRFSTLFDTSKPPPPPPTPRAVECCHRAAAEKSKRGVFLSTPVFVLLVVALLFESTLLFAYTVIGLYGNLPTGFAGIMGMDVAAAAPGPVDGCRCGEEGRGVVNFAPNFVFGGEDARMMSGFHGAGTMVEATAAAGGSSTTTSATPTTPTTSSTTSTSINSTAAAAASQLLSILSDATADAPTTASVAIVTSTPGVVHSTILVTSSLGGEEETGSAVRPTVTSVKVVDGPETTIQARDAGVTGGSG